MAERSLVEALREEEIRLQAELAKTKVYRRLEKVRELLAEYDPDNQAAKIEPPEPFVVQFSDEPQVSGSSGDPVLDAAEQVIIEKGGGPIRTAVIFEELDKQGIEIAGKEPRNTLSAKLSYAKNRFVSHGRSGWTVKRSEKSEAADDESPAALSDILG